MKKICAFFTIICMVIMFSSCEAKESKSKVVYGVQNDSTFRIWEDTKTEESSDVDFEVGSTDIDKEIFDRIQVIGENLVKYINKTYDMNWAYEYVPVKMYDFTNTKFAKYNAYYSEPDYAIYLNSNFSFEISGIDYILAHELIHYIRHLNIGTTNFHYKNTDVLGYYTMEALTELIVIDAFGGTEEVEKFFVNNSAYCYQVTTMKILRMSIPNLIKYYLNNDMSSFEKDFNKLSKKYVDFSGTDVKNHFINYLDIVDASYVAYDAMTNAYLMNDYSYMQYYAQVHQKYLLGQYELSLLLLKDRDNQTKEMALSYIDWMYRTELESEGIYGEENYEYYKNEMQFLESVVK